ncbi:uncharacterized protein LOC112340793 isoform X2 [Selaginella moellendorffii]|nr:uncharacterized protein LOC112340793 isoform X2 [Selaginella moellendorffii]XP_024515576.1 uncharacterized protein LOC112340793 isoform X2 [Selaginella moellendorffii]XP_024515577.1 uncharacterized protein LOC112340793 isoform X2 [Selaginella moellendorffii]XP_024515578.1 uncharacterized protein LOC112340793 isoform X2 [Selaginella moellendorffii]|eukprot:XP_024515575.1 uncharacterized protein LOC112340793 isoform X2 [Selaginella moellendorffii]
MKAYSSSSNGQHKKAYSGSSNGHYSKAYDGSSSNGQDKKAYGGSSNGQHNVFTKEKPKEVDIFAIENPAELIRARYQIIGTHRPGEKEGLLIDQCRKCKERGHWERHCKGPGVDPFAHEQKKCYLCLAKGHDTYQCSRDPLRNEDWAERTYTGPMKRLDQQVGYIVQGADFPQYHPRFCVQRIEYENLKRICKKHPDLGIFIVPRPPCPLASQIWEYFQRLDEVLYEAGLGFEFYRSDEEVPPGYDRYAAAEEAYIEELKNEAKH